LTVVDTQFYYGDNPLGISARDSSVYSNLNHYYKMPAGIFGIGSYNFPIDVNIYIPAGNQVRLRPVTAGPTLYLNGPQYYTANNAQYIETDNGDSVFFIYGYKVNKDTLGAEHLRHYHRITGKVQLPG